MPKKHLLYIIFIVVFVFVYQYSGYYYLQGEDELIDAFNNTEFELKEGQLSVWGIYNKTYMTKDKRWDALENMARELSLEPGFDYEEVDEGSFKEVKLIKKSKYAETVIKLITMEKELAENIKEAENYLVIDLTLYRDINSILHYKKIIQDLFASKDIKGHVSINITGEKEGILQEAEKLSVANELFGYVNAKKQEEFVTDTIYSIYGYSSLIDDYIISNNKKINVDLAFTYNAYENKTNLYLATPIITIPY
jgi:hypothetical protein